MNKTVITIISIVSFLLGIFLMSRVNGCERKPVQYIKDSFNIHHVTYIDTIPFIYKEPKITRIKNNSFDSTLYRDCNVVRYTLTPIKDSFIDGNILTTIRQNQLMENKLTYKPLFPRYIYKTDSIIRNNIHTVTNYEPYKQSIFYVGGSVGTNNIGITADIKDKKDFIYGYRFQISYSGQKSHNIEFKLPLFKTKIKNKK